jgi:hypothetical protein
MATLINLVNETWLNVCEAPLEDFAVLEVRRSIRLETVA